jgi:hypothetical protein
MVLSLFEAAKLHATNGDYKKAGVVSAFASSTPVLAAMPIVTIQGSAASWTEESVIATAAWRAVNSSYVATEGKSKIRTEPLKICGGLIQIDRAITQMLGLEQQAAMIANKTKGVAQQIGFSLLAGDAGADPKSVDGLLSRCPIGGTRAVSNSNAPLSMKKLDETIDEVSNPTHIILNRAMARNITSYLRGNGTAIQMMQDAFGRRVMAYNDLPFVIADPVDVDTAYRALPFTEASSTCSMLVVSLGVDALHLIQGSAGLDVSDIGVNDTGILRGSLVEWAIGIADEGPRCIARLTGITDATAAA